MTVSSLVTRRLFLGASAATLAIGALPGMTRAATPISPGTVLRAGDQKGGNEAVMKAAGVLDDLPYKLQWNQFAAAAPLLEALNAGAVDTAYASDSPTTFALASGVEARIVAAYRGSGAGTAIVVPANSPIHEIGQLKGHPIATNRGSVGHALLLAIAEREGWSADDIRLANLLPSDAKAALAAGSVEAWSTWNVYVAQAQLVDGARVIIDGGNGLLSGLSFVTATTTAITEKRAALADFLGRLARARRWALQNTDAYARVLAAEIGVSEAVAKRWLETDSPRAVAIDDQVIADEQRTADRYQSARLIRARLDATAVFDRSFNAAVS
ncbi:MAG TPA: ABC transporter substrate-binding protein [Stellaceae bacterium]|nr:ABC transporter substrate-binding protein [Stellaceae bacterium]